MKWAGKSDQVNL